MGFNSAFKGLIILIQLLALTMKLFINARDINTIVVNRISTMQGTSDTKP
jgi:hypothetical protein